MRTIWSPVRTEGRPYYYLALLLFSNVCAGASWGILTPTIIANCLARGSSTLVIGILTSIWALPFLLAAPIYTRIVGRVSAKPALLVGMSADVVCVWLFPLVPYDWAWIILQIVSGATLGHFSLITEAWLNLFSGERSRGRVTSLYGILPAFGYALGAGIYALVGYQGYAPYLAASTAMAIGILPILLIPKEAADIVLGGEERLRQSETQCIAGHERRSTSVYGVHGVVGAFTSFVDNSVPLRWHRHGHLYPGSGNSRTAI